MIKRTLTTAAALLALGGTALATTGASAATTGHYPTRAYARTCHAFARWQAAGLPSWHQTRTLARDALELRASLPDQVLRSDVSTVLLAMVARTDAGNAAGIAVAHDCHLPATR